MTDFARRGLALLDASTSDLAGNVSSKPAEPLKVDDNTSMSFAEGATQLRAREQIQGLADFDDLTGMANKRYFRRQLPQEIDRALVYSFPLSLLMIDVDDFKEISDSFGHTIGDVVLSELCGAVWEMLRPPDLFARLGGDEFAIILPHTDLANACAVADRILQRVREMSIPTDEESTIRCSISIGIACHCAADTAVIDFVRRADERLYEAKRAGKNRYSA